MHKKIIYLFLALIFTSSCKLSNNAKEPASQNQNINSKETLEKANKYLIRTEREDIENYIRRHKWQMEETGSGLQYMIYEKGDGQKATSGKIAVLDYKLSLLTGDIIYSSDEDGQKIFEIGKGNVESGLDEAIRFMQVGDRAKLILPAHLAYGLLGDDNKIPARCTLIYDMELIDIK